MTSHDPRGYYRYLGVQPDAPASVIKAAYRALAKKLHPDRNKNAESTAAFQAIQKAYEVLSNESTRRKYDADSAVPVEDSRPKDTGDSYRPLEPVRCSKCNAISAQPKFKVFYTVFGYLVGARKSPQHGVFCSGCETRTALRCSAITLVAGWWSVWGSIFTLESLFHNLVGGEFHEQNARLQAHQAFYFAQSGQLELARAVAVSALATAEKAKSKNRSQKDDDSTRNLKRVLSNFIESMPPDLRRLKLKSTDAAFNRRFVYQFGLLVAVAVVVLGVGYATQTQIEAAERQRLEQAGIDRAKAAAIAESDAAVLKSLEEPLPASGAFWGSYYDSDTNPPLKINNSPDSHTLLKLVNLTTGHVVTVFIRAGESVEIGVPTGNYEARIASGRTWYGDTIRFGPQTGYARLDEQFRFSVEGNHLVGNEVTLTRVVNGNLSQTTISAAAF